MLIRKLSKVLMAGFLAGSTVGIPSGVASATEWPSGKVPGHPFASSNIEYQGRAITPDQPGFWQFTSTVPRIISPYGNSTRIVCNSGVKMSYNPDCYQADAAGNPHKLINFNPFNFFSGGTYGYYIYPVWEK